MPSPRKWWRVEVKHFTSSGSELGTTDGLVRADDMQTGVCRVSQLYKRAGHRHDEFKVVLVPLIYQSDIHILSRYWTKYSTYDPHARLADD